MTAGSNRAVAITSARSWRSLRLSHLRNRRPSPRHRRRVRPKPAPTTPATQKPATAKPATAKPAATSAALRTPSKLTEIAPATFRVNFETSVGAFVVEVTRAWAPKGADRFYNLVKHGYFDGNRFFRVVSNFMVQFGIHGDPKLNAVWSESNIVDDPVVQSNKRGFVTFATSRAELTFDPDLHQLQGQRRSRSERVCALRSGGRRHGSRRQDQLRARRDSQSDAGHDSDAGQRLPCASVSAARLHQVGENREADAAAAAGEEVEPRITRTTRAGMATDYTDNTVRRATDFTDYTVM